MRIVSTSYSKTPDYSDPVEWLKRISFYTGFLEELAKEHEVISIERINYEGRLTQNSVDYYFMNLPKKVVRFPMRMHRFIKEWKPDVVLNYPSLVDTSEKPRCVPENRSWVHLALRSRPHRTKPPSTLGGGRCDRIEFRSSQPVKLQESPSRDRTRY